MGEGAGALVLEEYESARLEVPYLCEIIGFGESGMSPITSRC